MEERLRVYLEDAVRFVEEAFEEFRKGLEESNTMRLREAAEKAWNGVVQASNALVLKHIGKVPSSHWERRRLLREIERKFPEVAQLGFRDRYSARERNLHELAFYEGVVDAEDLAFELEKARKHVEDVVKLLGVERGGGELARLRELA